MRRLAWHLKRIGETNDETALLEMIAQHEVPTVVRRDGRFVVYEYSTEDQADATLVYNTHTEIRCDDFELAVYALYRPNTAASFSRTFAFALVVTYEELCDHERTVSEHERTAPEAETAVVCD